MHSNVVSAVSQSELIKANVHSKNANIVADIAGLNINDGPDKTSPFAAYDSEPPPAPKLQSDGVISTDITEEFTNAAQRTSRVRKFVMASRANYATELDVGQLIKDPYFTLFESVGALEVSRSPRQDLVNSR
jgi:hypothetical protein